MTQAEQHGKGALGFRELAAARPMETLEEDVEYSWREVVLPRLLPVVQVPAPKLERETGERRRSRDLLVAVDFGPNSKHTFDWALAHLARVADTVHAVTRTPTAGSTEATSWKFLIDATVIRPRKLRHQHCSCSCQRGALFFRSRGTSLLEIGPDKSAPRLVDEKSTFGSFPLLVDKVDTCSSNEWMMPVGVGAFPPS